MGFQPYLIVLCIYQVRILPRIPKYAGYLFGHYDQRVINVSDLLRMSADMLEKSQTRVTQQREQSGREIDPQAISDAIFILGASGIAVIRELIDSLPDRPKFKSHFEKSSFSAEDVEGVVNQLIARLGLVEETELAALRKRIADLEAKLAQ